MTVDQTLLDNLSAQAKGNPRLWRSCDLRNSEEDNSQRVLNALGPGTVMPIHCRMKSSESIAIIRGKLSQQENCLNIIRSLFQHVNFFTYLSPRCFLTVPSNVFLSIKSSR